MKLILKRKYCHCVNSRYLVYDPQLTVPTCYKCKREKDYRNERVLHIINAGIPVQSYKLDNRS